jgi:hypothetical protein
MYILVDDTFMLIETGVCDEDWRVVLQDIFLFIVCFARLYYAASFSIHCYRNVNKIGTQYL